MPCRLAPCDLGDPGWGDPWFPHGALVASLTFWYGLVMFLFMEKQKQREKTRQRRRAAGKTAKQDKSC